MYVRLISVLFLIFVCPALGFPATTTPLAAQRGDVKRQTVYVTRTGTKYHRAGCRHLRRSSIPISLDEARRSYDPCKVCRP